MLIRRMPAASQRVRASADRLSGCLLVLLAAMLPFEAAYGGSVAGVVFTNLELALLAALAAWLLALVVGERFPRVDGPARLVVLSAAALLLALGLSAVVAPEWRGAALKFTARQAQGVLLLLCLVDQLAVRGRSLAHLLGVALLGGAAASAVVGLLELAAPATVLPWLEMFKDRPTTVGGLLRLSATFGYANIAAMFYEALLPLAVVGVAIATRPAWRVSAALCAALLMLAALLTYSRAALATAPVCVVLLLGVALLRRAAPGARAVALCCAGLLVLLGSLWALSPAFRLRVGEPDIDKWYRAEYSSSPAGVMAPASRARLPVTVRNNGLFTWRSEGIRPVVLSYHWLDAGSGDVVRWNGLRTALPAPVPPGASADLQAEVEAPQRPGNYVLAWDMVEENSAWFSARGSPPSKLAVAVQGAPARAKASAALPDSVPPPASAVPPSPARSRLWAAALQMWRSRPLLGIGPDVFRHAYGPLLGLQRWDDRIHTNNLYLELLVGGGIVGLALLFVLLGAALLPALTTLWRTPAGVDWWALLGCAVALLAYLIHGVLDMFLEFSATYLLFWGSLGALAGLNHSIVKRQIQTPASSR